MEVSDTVEQYKQLAFQPQYQNVRPPAWWAPPATKPEPYHAQST